MARRRRADAHTGNGGTRKGSGNNLFVGCENGGGVEATVGEYTTAGATVNASLISGLSTPFGIAISPVPEPSSGALVGLGAAALWRWRRYK